MLPVWLMKKSRNKHWVARTNLFVRGFTRSNKYVLSLLKGGSLFGAAERDGQCAGNHPFAALRSAKGCHPFFAKHVLKQV